MILRIGFWKIIRTSADEKCGKLISCLGTDWENKKWLLSSKISNLIQLLVSVMSHCSQTFS